MHDTSFNQQHHHAKTIPSLVFMWVKFASFYFPFANSFVINFVVFPYLIIHINNISVYCFGGDNNRFEILFLFLHLLTQVFIQMCKIRQDKNFFSVFYFRLNVTSVKRQLKKWILCAAFPSQLYFHFLLLAHSSLLILFMFHSLKLCCWIKKAQSKNFEV